MAEFDRSCRDAAIGLSERPNSESPSARSYQQNISSDSLYRLTHDLREIAYHDLDALARFYDVPMSVILLYTRVCSEVEKDIGSLPLGSVRAKNVVLGFANALNFLEQHIDSIDLSNKPNNDESFSYEVFMDYIEAYRSQSGYDQPSML